MTRTTVSISAPLRRCGMLLLVAMSFGCRSAEIQGTGSVKSDHKIASLAPRIAEAEQHHEEVRFLRRIAELSNDPAFEPILATFREAETARHHSDSQCVALYAEVALNCWPLLPAREESPVALQAAPPTLGQNEPDEVLAQTNENLPWLLYHRSLERMTEEAARFGLLDPQRGISIAGTDGQERFIAITHHGFPWTPEDFSELHVIGSPLHSHLKRYWAEPGLGVTLVAIRERPQSTPHMGRVVPYAATAVLRPAGSEVPSELHQVAYQDETTIAELALHDPLRVTEYSDSSRQWNLARDLSAPLGFARSHLNRDNVKSFLNPARDDEYAGLRMLEPYQPGKIPIIFVHGLLSDRLTWLDLINDLRNIPAISEHYQIWLYQYPTGQPFIFSATSMRQTLLDAVQELDPQGRDPALSEMVLIGHSMGGLVSKLLITTSETELWDSIANLPIDEVKIAPEKRAQIDAIFSFEPLPFVKRVIFIGSPHQGSKIAKSWIGVVGSKLVHGSKERTKTTKTILHDNPGVFKDLEKHLPTSVDLLRPDNPILMATYELPVHPDVKLHTIIGKGHPLRDGTDADGVVPVESARHPLTVSERLIDSSHTGLPDHPETTDEVARILHEHIDR